MTTLCADVGDSCFMNHVHTANPGAHACMHAAAIKELTGGLPPVAAA